jgi:hypothetical protein
MCTPKIAWLACDHERAVCEHALQSPALQLGCARINFCRRARACQPGHGCCLPFDCPVRAHDLMTF